MVKINFIGIMIIGCSCTDGANKIHNKSSFEHFEKQTLRKKFFF